MANHIREQIDLLCSLKLPDRYEPLYDLVGHHLAEILVEPSGALKQALQSVIDHVKASSNGAFLPILGKSGAGKTTFVRSLSQWFARDIASTALYGEEYGNEITFEGLKASVFSVKNNLPKNDNRIIPINIDHRESDGPNPKELAVIKRFLRESPCGCQNLIFWPEVEGRIAHDMAENYQKVAGAQPYKVLTVSGPEVSIWKDIAISTLKLSNNMENLEQIGVNPESYDPEEFQSIGEFLRKIQIDFNRLLSDLRKKLNKAVVLIIIFVSESSDPGVLNFINSSSRHGVLDAQGLLGSSPDSVIGKWWKARQGLLVRTIVQLNAHALFLSPPITVSILRNLGPANSVLSVEDGVRRLGPAKAIADLARTDIAKVLQGQRLTRYEGRGNPAENSVNAFREIAKQGFILAADKKLNSIMAEGWQKLLERQKPAVIKVCSEKALDFCTHIIPDNSVIYEDTVFCLEYTWRKGEFLEANNRSTVAQYIMTKLRNYVRELGWTAD